MEYRLLVLDIDGTLRPSGEPCVPRQTAEAVRQVQKAGVQVAVATGRGRASIPKNLLHGIKPDFWLCSAGAHLTDAAGNVLIDRRMTPEQMYALVDFFEDYDYPLRFIFLDGGYAYIGYEEFLESARAGKTGVCIKDGLDQDRHLEDMPFTAFGRLPREAAERFQQKCGYLGLRFVYDDDLNCDILPPEVDKAAGLRQLLEHLDLPARACVAVGDGDNDVEMLALAGLGVCVENGSPAAQQAADRLCPPAGASGVATLCRELWPEAFAARP